MKHIALVLTFAGVLPAQQLTDPRVELAKVIAVEEQEHDLAKAETLYRAALNGSELSESARALANLRLGQLLQALGKDAEAKPFLEFAAKSGGVVVDAQAAKVQDPEREKALRDQARELVVAIRKNYPMSDQGKLRTELGQQLSWLGAPAVPEVVAALEVISKSATGDSSLGTKTLIGFLWEVADPKASACFVELARHPVMALVAAGRAWAMRSLDIEAPEFRAFAEHRSSDVAKTFLLANVVDRLNAAQFVEVAERASGASRALMLVRAQDRPFDPATLSRLHHLVRAGLDGTDPELGQAAEQFLMSESAARSIEGVSMILERLPRLRMRGVILNFSKLDPTPALAVQLWPRIAASIKGLGKCPGATDRGNVGTWLSHLVHQLSQHVGPEATDQLLEWLDLGYPFELALAGRVTTENAARVFARFPMTGDSGRDACLRALCTGNLPSTLFPAMREQADKLVENEAWVRAFMMPMARTGNPEAGDWIVTHLAKMGNDPTVLVDALLELGHRTQAENVRVAMRQVAEASDPTTRSVLLLALLSMHDVASLPILAGSLDNGQRRQHPYAKVIEGESPRLVTPLQYLLYSSPNPPHGFTEQEVVTFASGIVRAMVAASHRVEGRERDFAVYGELLEPTQVSDRVVMLLAELGSEDWKAPPLKSVNWRYQAALRISQEDPDGTMHRWLAAAIASKDPARAVVSSLGQEELSRIRPQLEQMLHGDDAEDALFATRALSRSEPPVALSQLTQSKHPEVRQWAAKRLLREGALSNAEAIRLLEVEDLRDETVGYLGERLAVEAVPKLIELLRDPRSSKEAAEALTRIRFYHEQQAHWDRVLKGLDASPASAVEKLLLQAKPSAPKAQRLLAIISLGTLGVPEALPFLIEWTQDPDADIVQKANAAITAIHLTPRK